MTRDHELSISIQFIFLTQEVSHKPVRMKLIWNIVKKKLFTRNPCSVHQTYCPPGGQRRVPVGPFEGACYPGELAHPSSPAADPGGGPGRLARG